jgi:hypothetical protein
MKRFLDKETVLGVGSWFWSGYQICTATHALLHFKHGSAVPHPTRPHAPAPHPFLATIDWSVHHSPRKMEGVRWSHILIPLVQDITG